MYSASNSSNYWRLGVLGKLGFYRRGIKRIIRGGIFDQVQVLCPIGSAFRGLATHSRHGVLFYHSLLHCLVQRLEHVRCVQAWLTIDVATSKRKELRGAYWIYNIQETNEADTDSHTASCSPLSMVPLTEK